MTTPLAGKVAVVTGSGQGIGSAIARRLAAEGASVVVNSRTEVSRDDTPTAKDCAAAIERAGGTAYPVFCDVGTAGGAAALVDAAVQRFGRLDILVNNAAVFPSASITETTEQQWDAVIATNLTSVYLTSHAAVPHLQSHGSGRIVNIISRYGLVGFQRMTAYSASKAGVIGLTFALAKEVAGSGLTVNCVSPSAPTERSRRTAGERHGADIRPAPTDPDLTPDHIPPIVLYLVSEQGGCYNGQIFGALGGEITLWAPPTPARTIKKSGMWGLDELTAMMPSAFGERLDPPASPTRLWKAASPGLPHGEAS
jgi:NAD(P)-dependent dehydrogenase (short-subunit alcohol dehydrogenase family)